MADNYIERQYEQYEARKAAWEKARKLGKKKLKTTRGMIDAVLRDGIGILVDFPGTAFRSLLLDPRDVEFVTSDCWNWDAKEEQ